MLWDSTLLRDDPATSLHDWHSPPIGNHYLRTISITIFLCKGSKLEDTQWMTHHKNAQTSPLYEQPDDTISLEETERIVI